MVANGRLMGVLGAMVLSAAAAAQSPQAAVEAHMPCVLDQVMLLDDGTASVEELAAKIAPTCRATHERAMAVANHVDASQAAAMEEAHTQAAVVWARERIAHSGR